MSERTGPVRSDPVKDPLRTRLERLVSSTRAALWWEGAWPLIWRAIGVVLLFLAVSWLGLWLDVSPLGRMIGVGAFAVSIAAALWPVLTLRKPGRAAALARLDREAGLKHGPARALEDQLALGSDDPGTRALWDLHRRRAEAAVGKLRPARPSPGMPLHDRYAVRSGLLVAAVASAFYAGPEFGSRLGSAFDWSGPRGAAPVFRIDGWIDPPLYTRTPPLMIDFASGAGEHRLRAPVRSTVVIRMAGKGDASITAGPGLTPLPAQGATRPDLREERFTVEKSGELTVSTGFASNARLVVEAIPDRPPEIAFAGPAEVNARGSFTLVYKARDDYGVVAAEGLVEKTGPGAARRSLVPAPKIPLALPSDSTADQETRAPADLTEHPWAGARVRLTLAAKDEAGQEGRSEGMEFTLPQRPFTKPLARALVEQRRNLVLDPDERRRVQTALDALLIEPGAYTKEWGVFLGLRTAAERLRRARTDADLTDVAEWLWAMALQIEDGGLSDAEKELRAAQDRLRDALDRNAPEEEVKKLTEELRQAMDKFLREFAERMQREQQQRQADGQPNQEPSRTVTPNDLNRMLEQIEEMMKRGDVAEAQRLLDELRNILENLQTAQPNSRMSDPMAREMQRSMEDLDRMAREQQELRDETFRQGQNERMQRQQGQRGQQQQGQRGQQGQQQQGQRGQQGEQGEQGQQGQRGQQGQGQQGQGLGERQQALRERLQELQRRMQGMGMQGEQGLADAEEAMREAEGALQGGREGQAVDAQGRAVESLRRGQQGMAQQMQQMQQGDGSEQAGDQPGQGQPQGEGRMGQRNDDPLGRPTRSRNFSDGRVKVPGADESAVQRARRIMDELRRKLGDPTREQQELDYFERLLRRN